MKKLPILLALALGGCASIQTPQVHVTPRPAHVIHKPKVQPVPIAAPLVKPKWYDRFRQKNGRWVH